MAASRRDRGVAGPSLIDAAQPRGWAVVLRLNVGERQAQRLRLASAQDPALDAACRQGEITLVFTGALDEDSEITDHVKFHGDGVHDVALRVELDRFEANVLEHPFYRRWECGELSRVAEYVRSVEASTQGLEVTPERLADNFIEARVLLSLDPATVAIMATMRSRRC